jgi:8-oxo-dGTP pyrophosphatase MutT (NUDIX family)
VADPAREALDQLAIIARLASHSPRLEPTPGADPSSRAAVAMILHAPTRTSEPELLLIERAKHPQDPWSGQMAFPGGRMEHGDPDLSVTAARETLEEVGIELGSPIGRLDDMTNARMRQRVPAVRAITVTPFVYLCNERPRVIQNQEVASTVWIPFEHIVHPRSASAYQVEGPSFKGTFPAFVYEGYKVWGMTYRIIETFAALFELSLPASSAYPESMRIVE